jgi:hypothetical protein
MHYRGAQETFNKLVGMGIDPEMLSTILLGYVFLGYGSSAPLWLPYRRTRRKLQSDMEDLAARLENLFFYPGISAGLGEVAASNDISLNSGSVTRLPSMLRNYGRFIGALPCKRSQKRGSSYKNGLLNHLVGYVKVITGKPHYALVAVLLNAADSAGADFEVTRSGLVIEARKKKSEGPRWDSVVLGQLIYREKVGKKRQTLPK